MLQVTSIDKFSPILSILTVYYNQGYVCTVTKVGNEANQIESLRFPTSQDFVLQWCTFPIMTPGDYRITITSILSEHLFDNQTVVHIDSHEQKKVYLLKRYHDLLATTDRKRWIFSNTIPYRTGAVVIHNNKIWESTMDYNTSEPDGDDSYGWYATGDYPNPDLYEEWKPTGGVTTYNEDGSLSYTSNDKYPVNIPMGYYSNYFECSPQWLARPTKTKENKDIPLRNWERECLRLTATLYGSEQWAEGTAVWGGNSWLATGSGCAIKLSKQYLLNVEELVIVLVGNTIDDSMVTDPIWSGTSGIFRGEMGFKTAPNSDDWMPLNKGGDTTDIVIPGYGCQHKWNFNQNNPNSNTLKIDKDTPDEFYLVVVCYGYFAPTGSVVGWKSANLSIAELSLNTAAVLSDGETPTGYTEEELPII